MNILRLFVPDLGENVFKSLGAMDNTTVKEVKSNLANKLVGLSTISDIDIAKFSLFEVKDGKEEKLDDNKLIMAVVKKWPKKGNTPSLVFKGDAKNKLQTVQHTPTPAPISPTNKTVPTQPLFSNPTPKEATSTNTKDNNDMLMEEEEMISAPMSISKINASPSPSSNNLNPSFSSKTINVSATNNNNNNNNNNSTPAPIKTKPEPTVTLSPSSASQNNEALLILNNFEKQWKSGKINSSHEILTALLGG